MVTASPLSNGIEGPARWSLRLFGGFELGTLLGGERVALPGKRERVLLAYLALSPNCRQPRRKLAALLWGDATDETLLDNLRATLWKLRKVLDDTEHRVLASDGEDIVLDAPAFEIDAQEFRRLAAKADRAELEAAAKLYAGEFLDGLDIESEEFEAWRRTEATGYRDQVADVLTRLMAPLAEAGETERAIETGTRILKLDPLNEGAVRRLMRLHAESGRRGIAVQLYRTLAEALKTELGAQPEAETRAVFAEIARGGEEIPAPITAETKPLPSPSIASPSVGPQSQPSISGPAQEGPALGAAQKFVPPQATTRPLAWIVAGGLAAAIALFLVYQFVAPITQPTGVEAAKTASLSPAGTVAIAVLPFVNLSSDPEQEFFSDGMTEEITSALAKVRDLRVVGRTSAFQFKGQSQDLRAIGKSLAATHLIEGSVRKAGDRVRITVQLIKTDDGTHIWSEDYDRQLTDIFAIQEDIARAITTSLRTPLGLKPGENLVNNRSIDPDSYQEFLHAKALLAGLKGRGGQAEALPVLESLVARNPDYAPAWAALGEAYARAIGVRQNASAEEAQRVREMYFPKFEAAVRRAIQLDPNSPDANVMQGEFYFRSRKHALAEDFNSKALALDPDAPLALTDQSQFLLYLGHVKEGLVVKRRLLALEPFVPFNTCTFATALWLNGQDEAAIAILKELVGQIGGCAAPTLAEIYASLGRHTEAADALSKIPAQGLGVPPNLAAAISLLRSAPAKAASPQSLPRLAGLGWVYLHIGAPERLLEAWEEGTKAGLPLDQIGYDVWHPSYASLRKTERFKNIVRAHGYVDYWRARGWPDLCHPTTGDDFACE